MVQRTRPESLIGYFPLDDTTTTAMDHSRTGSNAIHVGDTLLAGHNPFGKRCPLFDGTNDYVSYYSSALNTAFSSSTLTLAVWAKVQTLGDWSNGEDAHLVQIGADANNRIGLYKLGADNKLYARSIAGGTTATSSAYTSTSSDWLHMAATLDRVVDELRFYASGELVSTTGTLGTWATPGSLAADFCKIGGDDGAVNGWKGYLAHCAVWACVLPADEIKALALRR
jgi:hypothetical protein